MFDYSRRVIMAILLLCMVILLPTIHSVMYLTFRLQSVVSDNDEVSRHQKRLLLIRYNLPRYGVIGYVGDRGDPGKEYRLTQYALAPLLVDPTPNHALVVGNFNEADADGGRCKHKGLVPVFDFGDGVCLFQAR
jgi:hypothetical protein